MNAIAEVELHRFWRYRCAEPAPGHFPVRCRRDLAHPDGHLGVNWRIVSAYGERPLRYERTYVSWPGEGNAVSAHSAEGWRCWCTLKREGLQPLWSVTEHPVAP